MTRGWVAGLIAPCLWAITVPGTDEIVKRSVANTEADWRVAPQYDFNERDVTTGSEQSSKTYRVLMIDGSPYNELIAANGTPLSREEAAAERRKLRQEIARRQHETPAQRQKRIEEYQRERRQDNALLREMIKAFDFNYAGEDTIGGRRCFVLNSTPKPGYQPPNRDTRVLTGMRGRMWVDEQQYQWVKVEAEVFRPVTFGLFIARVEPGTQFMLEQRPVNGNLWLPSHFSVNVKAKVLGLWSHNSTDDETYWAYEPISQDRTPSTAALR